MLTPLNLRWLAAALVAVGSAASPISNLRYTVDLASDHTVTLSAADSGRWVFRPDFVVLRTAADVSPALRPGNIERAPYNVLTWLTDSSGSDGGEIKAAAHNATAAGDGFDDRITKGDTKRRTANVFRISPYVSLTASDAIQHDNEIDFVFPAEKEFRLRARLRVPPGEEMPVLQFELTAIQPGYYSVGYTGAPAFSPSMLEEVWQPFIWQGKRFPNTSYVTAAFECSLPAALVTYNHATAGVVVDATEFPFQPLPLLENSRFGVALRNAAGEAQPMVFAPLPGGTGSKIGAGGSFSFKFRLVATPGRTTDAYERIAREVYGFKDYRSNAIGTLNETIDRMVEYGMSDFSHFIVDMKGCAYSTDVPGAVKNVSSLNPLEVALITDDEAVFRQRAYPILEFLLSREKYLFTLDRNQKIQSPSRNLKGPCAPVSELAALYGITHGATPFFLQLAGRLQKKRRVLNLDEESGGPTWQNALAMYETTGHPEDLARARKGADEYIRDRVDKNPTDFQEHGLFFFTSYAPDWIDLKRMHDETGDPRYLEAARQGARDYAQFIWMSPAIPDQLVTVNPGGKAPVYWYLQQKGHKPMTSPEEAVPAWRLSEIGLTPESSGTMSGHRAIFMANFAAWMSQIAAETGDSFLHDIARSAIVGRYTNFPGYHINTARTTIYEKANYPLHEHEDLSVNSFHYNHIWPHLSLLLDFLVADVSGKSAGAIKFPARFIEAYGYLQSNFYGDRVGVFYGHSDAQLWMPRHLLKSTNSELNFLAARGQSDLYLAFSNQAGGEATSQIILNAEVLPALSGRTYQLKIISDGHESAAEMRDGQFSVRVSPRGLTAVIVEGLAVVPRFQQTLLATTSGQAWSKDYAESDYGGTRAMILNFGPAAKTAYVYLQADDTKFKKVSLIFDAGQGERILDDSAYPFEFTVPLGTDAAAFHYKIRGTDLDGKVTESAPGLLQR